MLASSASPATATPPMASTSEGSERARAHAHHREVARPAAEVGDQHDALLADADAELARRRDRLGEEGDLGEAGLLRRLLEAALGEGVLVGVVREARRAAEDDARDLGAEVGVRADAHLAQERRDEIVDEHRAVVDVGAEEAARGEVPLDGSEQAPFEAVLRVPTQRLLAVVAALGAGKVEDAAQDGRVAGAWVDGDGGEDVLLAGRGEERVAGAEVEGVHRRESRARLRARLERGAFHGRIVPVRRGFPSCHRV